MRQEEVIEQRVVVPGLRDDFRCLDTSGKVACCTTFVGRPRGRPPPAHGVTITFPVMCGCSPQKYAKVPAVLNVNV